MKTAFWNTQRNTTGIIIAALLLIVALVFLFNTPLAARRMQPYPASQTIKGVIFDWSTHDQRAPGSDNWPVTWADDDHQYTSWGDGGGFGGTNDDGRASLGFGRVEGEPGNYRGVNLWGGKGAGTDAGFGGKTYGIISIDGTLYTWRCGKASEAAAYDFQELYRSRDHGEEWEFTGVRFDPGYFGGQDRGFFCPGFLQFGKDYQGARDSFVYFYAPEIVSRRWEVQKPGKIALVRAPKNRLDDITRYEFFAGLDGTGKPKWTSQSSQRQPVFQDVENGVMRTSASYNAGLRRYFLITEHTERSKGNIGIYDAPEPWGPWTTVLFETAFGSPHIEPNTFYWNFSNKWLSADGKRFVLVFTGKGSNDSWNTVEGTFAVASTTGPWRRDDHGFQGNAQSFPGIAWCNSRCRGGGGK